MWEGAHPPVIIFLILIFVSVNILYANIIMNLHNSSIFLNFNMISQLVFFIK